MAVMSAVCAARPNPEGCSQEHPPPNAAEQPSKRRRPFKAPARSKDGIGVPEQLGSQPLRLLIVGSNPSDHAWYASGHHSSRRG